MTGFVLFCLFVLIHCFSIMMAQEESFWGLFLTGGQELNLRRKQHYGMLLFESFCLFVCHLYSWLSFCSLVFMYSRESLAHNRNFFMKNILTLNVLYHTTPHKLWPWTTRSMHHQLLEVFGRKWEFLFYTMSAREDRYVRIKNQLITSQP